MTSYRRIVTGINAEGRSEIQQDGPPSSILNTPGGGQIIELWRTGAPCDLMASIATTDADPIAFAPLPGGTSCRVVRIPPDSKRWGAGLASADLFAAMGASGARSGDQARHPGMHVTPTIDYVCVIRGEIVAVMEDNEARLAPGDMLVQRATVHAWKNETDDYAEMFVVMVGIDHQAR
ncbi:MULTISPECIES: cupin domain-containing protein [unclassified Chelatococcus]|uniref:cupin domain-containing protein n=1 Tax=unclassified Chelatococcus TaxID=2638111 RepID=UPI001BCB06EF|nr:MULTISPECIES: cupin domain-containing protein [unclassified Chelatococcus]CAH1650854.1 Cupin domain-containing protein [Hyphomicrobiales bacterium]MBS7743250.1 cupin domain-containing protein [Chelatococcus sp. HY11]MBX3541632.1 cupin domain-containing protein [Chelatococcus sp.]MCO5074476.1 cupin domain-containing protein [Chelatococcus sp.]CAH1692896.1 Cupin domain-containing protein [Hyphomicrobiales bacterium]